MSVNGQEFVGAGWSFPVRVDPKTGRIGLSHEVRDVEEAIRRRNELAGQVAGAAPSGAARPPSGRQLRPPGLLELEDLLSGYLNTSVKVEMGAKKGRLVIDFATLEDLERLYRRMTEAS